MGNLLSCAKDSSTDSVEPSIKDKSPRSPAAEDANKQQVADVGHNRDLPTVAEEADGSQDLIPALGKEVDKVAQNVDEAGDKMSAAGAEKVDSLAKTADDELAKLEAEIAKAEKETAEKKAEFEDAAREKGEEVEGAAARKVEEIEEMVLEKKERLVEAAPAGLGDLSSEDDVSKLLESKVTALISEAVSEVCGKAEGGGGVCGADGPAAGRYIYVDYPVVAGVSRLCHPAPLPEGASAVYMNYPIIGGVVRPAPTPCQDTPLDPQQRIFLNHPVVGGVASASGLPTDGAAPAERRIYLSHPVVSGVAAASEEEVPESAAAPEQRVYGTHPVVAAVTAAATTDPMLPPPPPPHDHVYLDYPVINGVQTLSDGEVSSPEEQLPPPPLPVAPTPPVPPTEQVVQ